MTKSDIQALGCMIFLLILFVAIFCGIPYFMLIQIIQLIKGA